MKERQNVVNKFAIFCGAPIANRCDCYSILGQKVHSEKKPRELLANSRGFDYNTQRESNTT